MDLGFIRSYVAGVSCSIFARKVRSPYFLNLGHRQLTQVPGFHVFSHWTHECSSRWFQHHGDRLRNEVMAAKKSLDSASITAKAVLRLLWRQQPEVFAVLQLLPSWCASQSLSRHWSSFDAPAGRIVDALRLMICRDLRKPSPSSPRDAERGARDWQAIIECICGLALELAEEYKSRFEQTSQAFFDWLGLCIILCLLKGALRPLRC